MKKIYPSLGWLVAAVLMLCETCREVHRRPDVRPKPVALPVAPAPVGVNTELRDELSACLRQNDFVSNAKWVCDRRVFALREALTSCGVGMDAGTDR